MSDLVDLAVEAHGGHDQWSRLTSVSARLTTGGVLWPLKGQGGVIEETTVDLQLHHQVASQSPFGRPGLRSVYTPERVAIEDSYGGVVAERAQPRSAFVGHSLETPWDQLHLAYFAGYALWTYLTQPFSWMEPGVRVTELEPSEGDGEKWRRLEVVFPPRVHTHSARNVYYLDEQGLIRRHDYVTEVLGSTSPAAHYGSDHKEFDGIVLPTRRRVYLVGEDGAVMPEPLVVSIDIHDVHYQ